MKPIRVIPILTVSGTRLVKTERFKKPIYLGDPLNAIKVFNDKEVDELVLLDIGATTNKSDIQFDLIREAAGECFMPLAYGGGIKNLDEIKRLFSIGLEKVILSSVLFEAGLDIVSKAASEFGSQSVVACIDVKKNFWGKLVCTINSGTKIIKCNFSELIKDLEGAGIGEIIINNVDRDGTFLGLDLEITEMFSSISTRPLVTVGGLNSIENIYEITEKTKCMAVGGGSFFSFRNNNRNSILISYPKITFNKQVK
jgi:cyclase